MKFKKNVDGVQITNAHSFICRPGKEILWLVHMSVLETFPFLQPTLAYVAQPSVLVTSDGYHHEHLSKQNA
jgi:hypothetical protein